MNQQAPVEPSPDDITFITPDTVFPGADLVELANPDGQQPIRIPGRIVAQNLPCSVDLGTGHPGCGSPDTMTLVRHPTRGMNLPGERVVGLLEHCTQCGCRPVSRLVTPTEQEITDGWATDSTF